jgi:hypothetical protein
MSVDLLSIKDGTTSGTTLFHTHWWPFISALDLAKAHGWKPLGTVGSYWQYTVGYDNNDGQTVLLDDSLAIADAIERGIEAEGISQSDPARAAALGEFMAFCRLGAFQIT